MLPGITQQQFRDDIVGLISGTITNVSSLSAGADIANSSISGTYPTGKYSLVNSSSNTFSKIHSTSGSTTHYFRLGFASNSLSTISLAQSYTSGTDTLINSVANTVNILPNPYQGKESVINSSGLTLVISNSCIHFTSASSGVSVGIHDLGENGVTSTYSDNMKMAFIELDVAAGSLPSYVIPYAYSIDGQNSAYTTLSGNLSTVNNQIPILQKNSLGTSSLVVEIPVFITSITQAYAVYGVLGLFRIPQNVIATDYQYTSNGVIRQSTFSHAVITE
jgi:hypothetical protein